MGSPDRTTSHTSHSSARLVTITGAGGCGKTRLALEAARRLAGGGSRRVWFVPLGDLTDGSLLAGRLAQAMRLPAHGTDPLGAVAAALAGGPAVLVLDNFEQLLAPAGPAAAPGPAAPPGEAAVAPVLDLLARLPELACLITSRQRLNVAGEHELPLAPLRTPGQCGPRRDRGPIRSRPDGGTAPLAGRLACESLELFVDRAQSARPGFRLTDENAADVAELCDLLEGIPLAIELAAARLSVLTPAQMVAHFAAGTSRLDLLASRQRDLAERHRTLRATVEWSYQLLPEPLARLLARLSVFRGGWTLAAADAVAGDDANGDGEATPGDDAPIVPHDFPPPEQHPVPERASATMLDGLEQLREASLVEAEESAGAMRFRMLETVREYAESRLEPAERDRLRRRHLDYFRDLARHGINHLHDPGIGPRLERLEAEQDNIWAALEYCRAAPGFDPPRTEVGLRLACALGWFWSHRGYNRLGGFYMRDLLAREDAAGATDWRAFSLGGAGTIASREGLPEIARPMLEEAVAISRALGEPGLFTYTLNALAGFRERHGDPAAARALLEESLAIRRATGSYAGLPPTLINLGRLAAGRGDAGAADAYYQEALELSRARGDLPCRAAALAHVGLLRAEADDPGGARALLQESLAIHRELGSRAGEASNLQRLGTVARAQGELPAARAFLEESLAIAREIGDLDSVAAALQGLGAVALDQSAAGEARELLIESLRAYRLLGDRSAMLALLSLLARLALLEGEGRRAAELLGTGEAAREQDRYSDAPRQRREHERALAAARAAVPAEEFAAAFSRGRHAELHAAVARELESAAAGQRCPAAPAARRRAS